MLVVCDGSASLKIFDATDPANVNLKQTKGMSETSDIIIKNSNTMVSAFDGIYQFSLNAGLFNNISKIGFLNIGS